MHNMNYTFTNVSQSEIELIYQLLGEVPLKIAGPLYGKLEEQRRTQEFTLQKQESSETSIMQD